MQKSPLLPRILWKRYFNLKKRIERSIKNGKFYRYGRQKQLKLLKKLQRYYERLKEKKHLHTKLATLGAGVLLSTTLTSQTFNLITSEESPFINSIVDPNSPFGLTDIGSLSTPTFVDIDNDGDQDAFVGNVNGTISYFKNVGSSSNPAFIISQNDNPIGFADVGLDSAPTFADIDGDGDFDLFIGNSIGTLYYYENVGSSNAPAFVLRNNTAPFGIPDIGSNSIPTFVDIDRDGDLDAFVGESGGNINYFENTSTDSSVPAYSISNSFFPFGLSDVGSYSAPTFVDIDGDGDLDAFVGESYGNTNYFINVSTNSAIPEFIQSGGFEPFGLIDVGANSAPVFVDIDNDGDIDAFIGESGGNINYFENTSTDSSIPAFQNSNEQVGANSIPTMVDIDNDGDLDVFVGASDGTITFFENITPDSSSIELRRSNAVAPFGLTDVGSESAPTFADIDGDGDQDAFVGSGTGLIYYFENVSSDSTAPTFQAPITNPFGLSTVGSLSTPAFMDADQDGDFDLFVGESNGNMNYFENISTNSSIPNFQFINSATPFGLSDIGSDSKPHFVDIDGDRDLDAFIGEDFGTINYFENVSTDRTTPSFVFRNGVDPFGLTDVGSNAAPFIGDIDGDRFYEALVGELEGVINYYESNISTDLALVEILTIDLLNEVFCSNETTAFSTVGLSEGSCDKNGNAVYSASITPANQGVDAIVLGSGTNDCDFEIAIVTTEDAVADDYSVNLVIEDPDGVDNLSNVVEVVNTGTTLVFNLGVIEVIDLKKTIIDPIPTMSIAEGESKKIKTNVSNTTDNTTYAWTVGGVNLPVLTGDDASNVNPVIVPLEGGGTLEVSAATKGILNGFTEASLDITNNSDEVAQNVEISLITTQFCGSDTVRTTLTAGDFECGSNDIILGNTVIETGFYQAQEMIVSKSIIPKNEGVVFTAGQSIVLEEGFHARKESSFEARIESCVEAESETKQDDVADNYVETRSHENELHLFPNPVETQLTIKNGKGEATIHDMLGRNIMSLILTDEFHRIDVSHLAVGQYVLTIRKQDGTIKSVRFVK